MPPVRIDPGRDKGDDEGAVVPGFFVCLLHPFRQLAPIGWVHEHPFIGPAFRKPVFGGRVVLVALRCFVLAARVEREFEFEVQVIEPFLGRCPSHVVRTREDLARVRSNRFSLL